MELNNLKQLGSKKRPKKRLGRGNGSKQGTFCGRGCKGQGARSGGGVRAAFEGGQTPITQRIPKLKGFKSPNKKIAVAINVKDLNVFKDNDVITIDKLFEKSLLNKRNDFPKILGEGKIEKKLTVKNILVSGVAKEKIEKAGGKIENDNKKEVVDEKKK